MIWRMVNGVLFAAMSAVLVACGGPEAEPADDAAGQVAQESAAAASTTGAGENTTGLTGEQLWIACQGCHNLEAGAPNMVGPNLHGIIGQPAGQVEGFAYSPALVKAGAEGGLSWQRGTLMGWILNTEAMVQGTWMLYHNSLEADEIGRLVDFIVEKSQE